LARGDISTTDLCVLNNEYVQCLHVLPWDGAAGCTLLQRRAAKIYEFKYCT